MVGLGRMGGAMAQRLLRAGHNVVAYDPRPEAVQSLEAEGSSGASSLAELASKLTPPRAVWIMAPVGAPTESAIEEAAAVLQPGDIIIDGGNSNYRDSMRRAAMLAEGGISFLDVGTSGGIWGLTEGYSLMVGGDPEVYSALEPIFRALAPGENRGHGYVGKAGAGHFVKMVHNAVEYGLMEAYAEGFELLQAKEEFGLDLAQVAGIWRHGSVVRSWLLDLTAAALGGRRWARGRAVLRGGLGRGPVGGGRVGGTGGACAGYCAVAASPLPIPPAATLCGQAAGSHAQSVRRP